MEIMLECCMTVLLSLGMLSLIIRLAKGEETRIGFCRLLSGLFCAGFWIGIVRTAMIGTNEWMLFFYLTGAMLSYTAMVFTMPVKENEQAWKRA